MIVRRTMILRDAIALATMLGMAPLSGVSAQTENPLGSHIGRPAPAQIYDRRDLSPEDNARAVTDDFGRCVVLTSPNRLEKALAQSSAEALQNSKLAIVTADCLRDGELRIPFLAMRGAIFRARYRVDFTGRPFSLAAKAPDFRTYFDDPSDSNLQLLLELLDVADCVVRAKPDDSRKLVMAQVGDATEQAGIAAIVPALGSCLPAGLQVKFTKAVVIGMVAESLYREAQAARTTSTASGQH